MQTVYIASFLTIAETGSFSEAARQLNLTQPALTQQIRTLEKELAFPLFIRKKGGAIHLSPAGELFREKAAGILAELDRTVQECRALAGRQLLRIAAISYDAYVLPVDFYVYLRHVLPQIELQYVLSEWDVLLPLQRGEAEVAICADCFDPADPEFHYVELGRTLYTCVMSPEHPLAGHRCIEPAELAQWPVHFSIPEYSRSYNEFAQAMKEKYPDMTVASPYAWFGHADVLGRNDIFLSVDSAASCMAGLKAVPLAGGYSMPYGLLSLRSSTDTVRRFMQAAEEYAASGRT